MKSNLILIAVFCFISFNLIGQTYFSLDSTYRYNGQNFLNSKQIVTDKDAAGKPLRIETINQSVLTRYREIEYHSNGEEKSQAVMRCFPVKDTCIFSSFAEWTEEGHLKTNHSFNLSGQVLDTPDSLIFGNVRETWDTVFFDSNNLPIRKITYGSNNYEPPRLISEELYYWQNGLRDSLVRNTYTQGAFKFRGKEEDEYDTAGNIISRRQLDTNRMIHVEFDYFYDSENRQILTEITDFRSQNFFTIETEYAPDDTKITELITIFSDFVNQAENLRTETFFIAPNVVDSIASSFRLDSASTWLFTEMDKYFYTELTTSVKENSFSEFMIFPNPAGQFLSIDIPKNDYRVENIVKVYDSNGNLKKQELAIGKKINLDVSELHSGIYFLKIGNRVRSFYKN